MCDLGCLLGSLGLVQCVGLRLRMLVETDGYVVALLILFHVIGHQSKYIYRVLSGIFSLGGGGGGEGGVNLKQIFPATQQRETFFRPSGGIRGHVSPENFEKIVLRIGRNCISGH